MQIKLKEQWKQENGLYKCPYCGAERKRKGICFHIWKKHGEGTKKKVKFSVPIWNKGLTKQTDKRIEESSKKVSKKLKIYFELTKVERRREQLKRATSLKKYRQACWFIFALNEYPKEFDFKLIKKYGWYSAVNRGNNINGITRDHLISIMYGFEHKVHPNIISHPANCMLVRMRENVSKNRKCTITTEELQDRIKDWDRKYGRYRKFE